MRKGSTRYVIEQELMSIAEENDHLSSRINALLYLMKKL